MTNKQIIVMILAFTLVAVFCATGVFADSFSSFPEVGSLISEVVPQKQFFCWLADASGYTSSNPLYLFNDLGVYENSYGFSFIHNGVSSSIFSEGSYLYFFFNSTDGTLSYASSSSYNANRFGLSYSSGSSTSPTFNGNYLSASDLSITFGDSFELADVTSAYVQSMTVPAGYALRIYSASSFTLQELDFSVPNSWNFPKDSLTSARYNGSRLGLYADENIVQGASADSGSFVPWVALNANLFGRASAYSYTLEPSDYTLLPSYSYVITNPFYAGEAVQNESGGFHQNTEMIATVYYAASDPVAFDLVPLRQSLSAQDGTFYYANAFDINSGVIHGTITPGEDEDPGTVDFGNPPIGGGNADQPPLSENTTIFGVLNTLTSTITDLFNRAGDAMHSLVESCNSFFTAVIAFYGWLPAEWSAVLWSFFIVLTVIGVVKLFL